MSVVFSELERRRVAALDEDNVKAMTGASEVRLSGNLLRTLPVELASVCGATLTVLDLSSNRLVEFPSVILQLRALERLRLRGNELESLPANLPTLLPAVRELDLGDNSLTAAACVALNGWKSLSTLLLDSNPLGPNPVALSDLPALTVLDMRKARLQHFPSLTGLGSLTELLLRSNVIVHFPSHITELPSLALLDMADNKLHAAHPTIVRGLLSLRDADFSYNQFTYVPLFEPAETLETLRLTANKISVVPEGISGCTSLRVLDLANNALQEIPKPLLDLAYKSLEELILAHNQLEKVPVLTSPFKLRRIDIKGTLLSFDEARPLLDLEYAGRLSLCHFYETVPQLVIEAGVYVGSAESARNLPVLQKLGITHILNAAEGRERVFADKFTYLTLGLSDTADENLLNAIPVAHLYIDNALSAGGRVLIHCQAGVSRSVAILASYVMRTKKMGARKALEVIQKARPNAKPIEGFSMALEDYEKQIVLE